MNENKHDPLKMTSKDSASGGFWSRFVAEPEPTVAHRLYEQLVRHARFPLYFRALGVADTPEGRFEILALHVGLVVRKLFSLDAEGRAVGQALFELMNADLDVNLRELGVGDLSVGKQVKRLAGQFYARLAVLNEAFDDGRIETLTPMLKTNVCGAAGAKPEAISHLVEILVALERAIDGQAPADLKAGRITLPDEPTLQSLGDRHQTG